jgi:hypothetical protein
VILPALGGQGLQEARQVIQIEGLYEQPREGLHLRSREGAFPSGRDDRNRPEWSLQRPNAVQKPAPIVSARDMEIQQDGMRSKRLHELQRRLCGGHRTRVGSEVLKQLREHLGAVGVVFNDENAKAGEVTLCHALERYAASDRVAMGCCR